MSVYKEILMWSEKRPAWQQDCLRRLVTQDGLSQQDIADLANLCKLPYEETDSAVASVPLSEEHLTQMADRKGSTALTSLENTKGINGLIPGQTLKFSPTGATVIYGDNAAGKSGYVRVLKRLCRARGGGTPVKPDAYSAAPTPPTARVNFLLDETDSFFDWQEGKTGPECLSNISVFDSSTAAAYVENPTDVAFTPAGLDVFTGLAQACEAVAAAISSEIKGSDANKLTLVGANAETAAGKLMTSISKDTDISQIEKMVSEAKDEETKISETQTAIAQLEANDPKKIARGYLLMANRFKTLLVQVNDIESKLGEKSINELKNKQDDYLSKKKAAEIASSDLFSDEPLNGVGSETWKVLWNTAKAFSCQHAYPDKTFPNTEPDSKCVLCLQPLSPEAKTRITRFEDFVQQTTQTTAKEAETDMVQVFSMVDSVSIDLKSDMLNELDAYDSDLSKKVREYLFHAAGVKNYAVCSFKRQDWTMPAQQLPPSVASDLEGVVALLGTKAKELDGLDVSEKMTALKKQLSELNNRQILKTHKEKIVGEVGRLIRRERLQNALGDTNTQAISRKSAELTMAVVTTALTDRFRAELTALGLKSVPILMSPAGATRGSLRHRIGLHNSQLPVKDVASEGEYRATALAGFLAELATEQSKSGIIFDDPVCSLDHTRRRKVADRLVQEAESRQVIIFTHDISFVMLLNEAFERRSSVQRLDFQIYREGGYPGRCAEGHPWAGLSVKDRIAELNRLTQDARTIKKSMSDPEYAKHVSKIYGKLRETWERAVESILFNGTIQRTSRIVHTRQLKDLDIERSDYIAIGDGMTKCSVWFDGHDEPGEINDNFPEPDELQKDVDALKNWVASVRARRSNAKGQATGVKNNEKPEVTA